MNTTITREELYENFATKEWLYQNFITKEWFKEEHEALLADFRSIVHEIADMLNGKLPDTNDRLDRHIEQNALEHSKFKRA